MPASHFYQPLIKTQRKPDPPPGSVFNTNLNIDPVNTPGSLAALQTGLPAENQPLMLV